MIVIVALPTATCLAGIIVGYIIARIERRTTCKHYTI